MKGFHLQPLYYFLIQKPGWMQLECSQKAGHNLDIKYYVRKKDINSEV